MQKRSLGSYSEALYSDIHGIWSFNSDSVEINYPPVR